MSRICLLPFANFPDCGKVGSSNKIPEVMNGFIKMRGVIDINIFILCSHFDVGPEINVAIIDYYKCKTFFYTDPEIHLIVLRLHTCANIKNRFDDVIYNKCVIPISDTSEFHI